MSEAQFAAFLAGMGISLPTSFYDGRPVTRVEINATPVDIHEETSSTLRAFGVDYRNPSMGSITVHQIDARHHPVDLAALSEALTSRWPQQASVAMAKRYP